MKYVKIILKGEYIGTAEMTLEEIRNAEKAGFTVESIAQ